MPRPSPAGAPFDAAQLETLVEAYRAGRLGAEANRLAGAPRIPTVPPRDLAALDADRRAELAARGQAALAGGRVGVLVMAGGMATRFGGSAKAVVPIDDAHPRATFLSIKLADARRRAERVTAVVMRSFATRGAVDAHLGDIDWAGVEPGRRLLLDQSVMPRLLPDGTPMFEHDAYAGLDDTLLFAPPGHGDLVGRLQGDELLGRLRSLGVEHLLVSNVDNLGATLDPTILGAHLEGGARLTAEVVPRPPGEPGASICELADGRVVIVEDLRLPPGVDPMAFPHFNVNTLWLDLAALEMPLSLRWFAVRKTVVLPDGARIDVLQLEQLVGQLSELVPTAYVEVDPGRFLPVKTRDDLARARPRLVALARAAGVID